MSADHGLETIPSANRTTRRNMEYMRSYTHVFERDDWFVNLLLGSLCFFIPVIGHLVFMGYQYQVLEGFIRRPSEKIPKFDFNQFTEMLTRGVYPFVVSLVLQFLMVPVFLIIVILKRKCIVCCRLNFFMHTLIEIITNRISNSSFLLKCTLMLIRNT